MNYYDSLETRSPSERDASLMARLPQQVAHAKRSSTYFGRLYAGFDAQAINSRQALARLPLTRKTDLHELQRAALPFGGLTATPLSALSRVFASPGPIYEPEGRVADYWRTARALALEPERLPRLTSFASPRQGLLPVFAARWPALAAAPAFDAPRLQPAVAIPPLGSG